MLSISYCRKLLLLKTGAALSLSVDSHSKGLRSLGLTLMVASGVFLGGCAAGSASSVQQTDVDARNADELLVVDCLLPGQVRKLGRQFTYLTPRRPIKTTIIDCEIRGGEYVAYDRANYATALKIWLPQAQEGDPAAQAYVGEIYEKGLGVEADYSLALQWYQKAAAQGYSRAQINLGYLYEAGLGVPRDLTMAMNWYRKASGLTGGDLEFVSSIEAAQRQAVKEEAAKLRQNVDQLQNQLREAREVLARRQEELQKNQQERKRLLEQLEEQKRLAAVPPTGISVPQPGGELDQETRAKLQMQLQEAQREQQRLIAQLAQQQLETAELRQALEQQVQKERALGLEEKPDDEPSLSETEEQRQLQAKLQDRQRQEQQLRQTLEERNERVAALQAQLATSRQQLATTIQEMEQKITVGQEEQQRLTDKLAQQQLRTVDLQQVLKQTQEELQKRQAELQAAQAQREQIKAELEHLKQAANTEDKVAQVERLEANLNQLQGVVKSQKENILSLQSSLQGQRSKLAGELRQERSKAQQLQLALNTRNEEIKVLQSQLGDLRGSQEGSQAAIKALEQELSQRDAQLKQQQRELEQQAQKIEQLMAESTVLGASAMAAVVETAPVGPSIEVIEPPLSATRGNLSALLRTTVSEIDLIGRVAPKKDLLSFRVNDQARELHENGLFKLRLPIRRPETPVNIVAIDNHGNRTALDFSIVPAMLEAQKVEQEKSSALRPKALEAIDFGDYHALVIGNNRYQHLPDLKAARQDAQVVADILRSKYGFKTKVLLDADRYAILSALNEFREKLTEQDNFLLYYAGHGHLENVNLRGYWLPVDAEPESSANWISNVAITDVLNVMAAKHILVVADSCYSGALTRSSLARLQSGMSGETKIKWFKVMAKTKARIALTSGGLKPVLDAGAGDHSIFAKAFLEVLRENNDILEGFRLYNEIQKRVVQAADNLGVEQDPQYVPIKYAGHEAGEFFFFPSNLAAKNEKMNPRLFAYVQ